MSVTKLNPNTPKAFAKDSLQNFEARLGLGTDNQSSAVSYGLNPITRQRVLLENLYRGSWIARAAVEAVADDMTRAGIDINSVMDPQAIEDLQRSMNTLSIWTGIGNTAKRARLYGGAIGVFLIDGQDMLTPLIPETIGIGQFRGIYPMDRWMVMPSVNNLITDFGPNLGLPKTYKIMPSAGMPLSGKEIHYSRVIRMEGADIPFFQKLSELMWGLSVLEPLYDRLVAFDSTTQGAAQLVYRAHLRIIRMAGFRDNIAAGGKIMEGVVKFLEQIRRFQTIEGLTVLDKDDEFDASSYTFAGISDVLLQFGQQISGATQIPLVRLFGQSPSGLSSTGESDMRNYYDGINAQQEKVLRNPVLKLLSIVYRSTKGLPLPAGFDFKFTPLWQLSASEKADIATKNTTAIQGAFSSGLVDRGIALKELRQASRVSGVWTNIEDVDIIEAEAEPPPIPGMGMMGAGGMPGQPGLPGQPGAIANKGAGGGANGTTTGTAQPEPKAPPAAQPEPKAPPTGAQPEPGQKSKGQ